MVDIHQPTALPFQQKNLRKGEMKNEKEKTFGMAHDIGYDDWAHAGNCSG